MSEVSELFKELAQVYSQTDIDYPGLKTVTLAQWALESGWGTSDLATEHFNFGGLKFRKEMNPYAEKIEYEAHDGVDFYCKFKSLEDFVKGYWIFLSRAPYAGWEDHTGSPEDFMNFIGPIYCPRDGYVEDVLNLMGEAKKLLDTPGTSPRISPRGQKLKVAVDPGHGLGNRTPGVFDPGAVCDKFGTCYQEADIVLEYGRTLRDAFEERGHSVYLTRENEDDEAPVARRARTAENEGCQAFISLHLNSVDNVSANGLLICYRDDEYCDFAENLRDALCEVTGMKSRDNQKRLDLAVLKFDGPALLLELGFIRNDQDRKKILDATIRQKICQKVAEVVEARLT